MGGGREKKKGVDRRENEGRKENRKKNKREGGIKGKEEEV